MVRPTQPARRGRASEEFHEADQAVRADFHGAAQAGTAHVHAGGREERHKAICAVFYGWSPPCG